MSEPVTAPGRRGRQQTTVRKFDLVDPTLDEPVERQVYRSLRRGIMRGLILPDRVLTRRSLAQHMNLSVQPVRHALKRLEADGSIEGRPQSGFHPPPGMTATEYDAKVVAEKAAACFGFLMKTPSWSACIWVLCMPSG